jgi:hypothetical protein
MKRVALYLKEGQIRKLKALARKQGLPWAFVARQAIDFYFKALEEAGHELARQELEESTPTAKPQRKATAAEQAEQRQQRKNDLVKLRKMVGLRVDDHTIEEILKAEDRMK